MASNEPVTQDLIIRAQDLTTSTLKQVQDTVSRLTEVMAGYTAQAEKGTGGTVALNNSIRDADQSFRALVGQQKALDDFSKALARVNEAPDKLAAARNIRDQFKEDIPASGKDRTQQQKDQLAELNAAARRAQTEVNSANRALERASARLKTLGVEPADVQRATGEIKESFDKIVVSITAAVKAQEGYKTASDAVKAAARAESEQLRQLEQAARDFARAQVQAARDAKREADDLIKQADKQASDYQKAADKQEAAQLKLAEEERAHQAELARFHALALTRFDEIRRKQTEAQNLKPDTTQTGPTAVDSVTGIIAPSAAARSTMQGLNAEIKAVSDSLDKQKIKTHDAAEALTVLNSTQNELKRQAGLVDALRAQQTETAALERNATRLGLQLSELGRQAQALTTVDTRLEAEIRTTASEFERASAAFNNSAAKLRTLETQAKAAQIPIHDLDLAQRELTSTSNALAAATEKATGVKGTSSTSLFGLRPSELAALSGQIKDIVAQLAAGDQYRQVIAQQGGRIFGIFEKNIFDLLKLLPQIATGIVVAGLAFEGFQKRFESDSSIRNFQARLIAMGETMNFSATQLNNYVLQIRRLGPTFDQAREAVLEFQRNGLQQQNFVTVGKAAQQMADIFGIKFPDAAKAFAEGVSGDMESLIALNKQIGFLNPSLYDEIKALFDAGKAAEAHNLIIKSASDRLQEASAQALSPFKQDLRDLRTGWFDFTTAIGNTQNVKNLIDDFGILVGVLGRVLTALGQVATAVANLVPGQIGRNVEGLANQQAVSARIGAVQKAIKDQEDNPQIGDESGVGNQVALNSLRNELTLLQDKQEQLREITKAQALNNTEGLNGVRITTQQATAAHAFAEEEKERLRGTIRQDLVHGSDAEKKADEDYLAEVDRRARARLAKEHIVATEETEAIVTDINERAKHELEAQRGREVNVAKAVNIVNDRSDQAEERGLKGKELLNARLKKVNDDRLKEEDRLRRELNIRAGDATPPELTSALDREADSRRAAAQRQFAEEGQKAGEKATKAEETAYVQLQAAKAKLDNMDKTNVEARLRAVDEEFNKYTVLIAQLKRAGGQRVDGLTPEQLQSQFDAIKEQTKANIEVETREAGINKLVAERKTLIEQNNNAIRNGTITTEEGVKNAQAIETKLNPQIKALVVEAQKFAKALGGADPSPAIRASQAKLQGVAADADPGAGGSAKTNPIESALNQSLLNVADEAKARDEIVKANKDLFNANIIGLTEMQAADQEAFDRTTKSIQAQTAAIIAQATAAKNAGTLGANAYQLLTAKAQLYQAAAVNTNTLNQMIFKTLEDSVTSRGVQVFDTIGASLGRMIAGQEKFGQVVQDAGVAFANFAAGILKDIATVILKQLILAEVSALVAYLTGGASTTGGSAAVSAATTGASAAVSGATAGINAGSIHDMSGSQTVPQAHEGGIIGGSNFPMRRIDPSWFVGAPRYHDGGMVTLQPNEQAAILQQGEEVLSKSNPRNSMNGGGSPQAAGGTQVRQVLVFDPKDISNAMAGSHGENTVITHIKNNASTIKTILN